MIVKQWDVSDSPALEWTPASEIFDCAQFREPGSIIMVELFFQVEVVVQ